jgi:hypothetical protein
MVIHIEIDERKLAYTAGDVIKGRVVLNSLKEEAVGDVVITFQGRTKTKIRKRRGNTTHIYRGRGSLFMYSQTLYQGHYTLRANRYEWPFEFRFPLLSQSRINDDSFDSTQPFRGNADAHQLPPTFVHSGRGFGTNFDAFTEYKLEATIRRPPQSSSFFSSAIEKSLIVNFISLRQIQQPDLQIKQYQQSFTAHTLRLLPEKADAKLTMKEKMRSTFKRAELPKVSFQVRLTYPTQVYPGGAFPVKIGVRYGAVSEDILERPPIYLDTVDVEAKTYIVVRAPGAFGDHHDNDSTRRPILNRGGYHVVLPDIDQTGELDSSGAQWFDVGGTQPGRMLVTPALQVDFSTYNISTYNRLQIKLRVSCADKQFSLATTAPLRVLPPAATSTVQPRQAMISESSQAAGPRIDISDAGPSDPLPPPPYIPAPTYDSLEPEISQKSGKCS